MVDVPSHHTQQRPLLGRTDARGGHQTQHQAAHLTSQQQSTPQTHPGPHRRSLTAVATQCTIATSVS
ncbi:MAG: hypothetical protein ACJAYX_003901 [Planctomycetota bacterium]|jgi:hypothetical protein